MNQPLFEIEFLYTSSYENPSQPSYNVNYFARFNPHDRHYTFSGGVSQRGVQYAPQDHRHNTQQVPEGQHFVSWENFGKLTFEKIIQNIFK